MDVIEPDEGEVLDIELEEDFLERNRQLANKNRSLLDRHNVIAVDVMGSIGSGKTSLIRNLTSILKEKCNVGIIVGDLTTEIDAKRLEQSGVKAIQINTGKECHLDAKLVEKALQSLILTNTDIIFIENVGNLICPAEFPLGAHKRLVVISVTEGPWMVVKHPYIFADADVVAINKVDLAEAMEVSVEGIIEDLRKVSPRVEAFPTNCRQSTGIPEIIKALNL